jgi:chromosome segregation ATPase
LDTIEHYWRKAAAGVGRIFRQQADVDPRLETLQRELLALTRDHQAVVAQLEKARGDFESRDAAGLRKIETLEQKYRQSETARLADSRRLAELEQLLVGIEAGYQLTHDRTKELEASLAETSKRLEARSNQLKFLQDTAGEQLHAVKTMLAEASSRLETGDNELNKTRELVQDKIATFDAALADTSSRFERADSEIRELRETIAEHARQLGTVPPSVDARLEAKEKQLVALEKQVEAEQRLRQVYFKDTQARVDGLEWRLNRSLLAGVVALALVAASGAILMLR